MKEETIEETISALADYGGMSHAEAAGIIAAALADQTDTPAIRVAEPKPPILNVHPYTTVACFLWLQSQHLRKWRGLV